MFDIQEELAKLPTKPGVYIMRNENDGVIYVGKAINLRNRVRQYFRDSVTDVKVIEMRPNIKKFEYIITDSELEALILEANLIKRYQPKYNILLKDDKTYPYLKITINEDFPRVFIVREHRKDKAKYFGPFTKSAMLRELLDLIYKVWPVRRCIKNVSDGEKFQRPCLNFHIGRCKSPCSNNISKEEYSTMIAEILKFLAGSTNEILKTLEKDMHEYSRLMEFEKAADIRDKINSIKMLEEKQKLEGNPGDEQDVIALASAHGETLVQVFFIRAGKMIGKENFMLLGTENETKAKILEGFISQFYNETTFIPKELLIEIEIDEKEILTKKLCTIKEQNVVITVPQKGGKLKLVELAEKNAIMLLDKSAEQFKMEQKRTVGAVEEIRKLLNLENSIKRIEAYDISNTQGYESVGSMIVFEDGKAKYSDYRKFKIKYVKGADDYASMEEIIRRRFLRFLKEEDDIEKGILKDETTGKFIKLPDIIFVDGGKGQVHSALKVLRELKINIPICGMIKDNNHRTRGLVFENRELFLDEKSEGFKLITRIQDETHRFAIEYHRKLREQKMLRSALDEILGIGPTRRKALLRYFGDIEHIKLASKEELLKADNMNSKTATAVFEFFRKEKIE